MSRTLILVILIVHGLAGASASDPKEADHAALRSLMAEAASALTADDASRFAACLAPGFTITFADQRRFTDVAAIQAYRDQLRQERGIASVSFAPAVDAPASFIGDEVAVATGTSTDVFTAADGAAGTVASRWTATVRKLPDGWRIATFHAGIDPFSNPVTARMRTAFMWIAAIAGFAGLVIGFGIGRMTARRA